MKRLFTFGCSHTNHGYPTWANLLAEEFDELYNFGQGGTGPLFSFFQISSLINNRHKWNLSMKDDLIVWLIPEENRHDVLVDRDEGHYYTTNTIHNDCEEWYTEKYKREFSAVDGLVKTTLYVESVVRLLQNHNLNFKIIPALEGLDFNPKIHYNEYSRNLKKIIGESTPLQTIAKNWTDNPHYHFFFDGKLEQDGHWSIPIHQEFCKRNFDFYKETNIDGYLDLHRKYITKTHERDERWASKYHYAYLANDVVSKPDIQYLKEKGVNFYGKKSQNNLFLL